MEEKERGRQSGTGEHEVDERGVEEWQQEIGKDRKREA